MKKKNQLKPMLFSNMKEYSFAQFGKDLIAGIIVAIIALPLSIALAIASGVDPQRGIYTAVVAGFIISFLGGSRVQIAGPTAAFATIVAGIVAKNGFDGLVIATIMAGIILVVMGLLKLGSLIKFIPYTITTGFTAGIAITLFVGQVKDFLGLTYEQGVENIETIDKIKNIFTFSSTFNYQALLVGCVSLAILVFWPMIPKVGQKVPASLLAVLAGIAMVKLLHWDSVKTIGDIAVGGVDALKGLPSFNLPEVTFAKVRAVIGDAFTIAILAAIESLLSCVVSDSMINSHHRPNQELVAQGVGNIGSALFGGIPATGAIARTAANIKNGGRTPIAGMIHAITLVLVLLFLMPYAAFIPMPTIAAILFQVAYNMSGWRTFAHLVKTSPKSDILVLVTTFVLTVAFDLVVAIAVGMVLACVLLMKRMADESSVKGWQYIDPDDDPDSIELKKVPQHVRVYEISGPMFFGAADRITDITVKEFTKVLVIRMRAVPALDATALHSLEQLYEKCKEKNVQIVFSHVNEQPMKTMTKSGFIKMVGEENFCSHIDDALKRADELGKEEK